MAATSTIWPSTRAARMRSARTSRMRALVWLVSVTMPACEPVSEMARWPRSLMAIAHSAQDIRSPVERSMSISRGSGVVETSSAIWISSSVVLPRADSTATTFWPFSRAATMRREARLRRSASATEVPPNFITTVPDTTGSLGSEPRQPRRCLVDHRVALAEREAHERAPRVLVVVEHDGGDGHDPRGAREPRAEVAAVGEPERADVRGDEVGAGGVENGQPRCAQACAQAVALGLERGGHSAEVLVRQAQRERDRGLERRAAREGEELLGGLHGGDELARARGPPDLPARDGERLAGRGDGQRAPAHPVEGAQRHVGAAVEDQVLVDLVGDGEDVALAAQR